MVSEPAYSAESTNHQSEWLQAVRTRRFYEDGGQEYAAKTLLADMSDAYSHFLRYMPIEGRILDVGCGAGRDLRAFAARGFQVTGVDSSATMVQIARNLSGAPCFVLSVEDMKFNGEFEGAWACASLLHLPKSRLASALRQIHRALVAGGTLFVSMQEGDGEAIASDGRFFSYYGTEELRSAITAQQFEILEEWTSSDSLDRSHTRWLNVVSRAAI